MKLPRWKRRERTIREAGGHGCADITINDLPPLPPPLISGRISRSNRRILAEVERKIAAGRTLWTDADGNSHWLYVQPPREERS